MPTNSFSGMSVIDIGLFNKDLIFCYLDWQNELCFFEETLFIYALSPIIEYAVWLYKTCL